MKILLQIWSLILRVLKWWHLILWKII
jgi:hypothetical protein